MLCHLATSGVKNYNWLKRRTDNGQCHADWGLTVCLNTIFRANAILSPECVWISKRKDSSSRWFFFLVLLLILKFYAAFSKVYEPCEFFDELDEKHNIPMEDIFKHFCIAGTLNTKSMSDGKIGIYRVESNLRCGLEEPGGTCNVLCADLLDDDIANDIKCMQKIYDEQGLFAWKKTRAGCLAVHRKQVDKCYEEAWNKNPNVASETASYLTCLENRKWYCEIPWEYRRPPLRYNLE